MVRHDSPTLSAQTRAWADTAARSDDGTLLPPTVTPNTGEALLLKGLPRVDRLSSSAGLELGSTIGEGGMGIVRVAQQASVGRPVAVKTLRPDKTGAELTLHLLREAWITGRLEHPNIIPVHDVGLDVDGRPLIVMKRVEGRAWSELIYEEDHDLRWHLRILEQVCHAVEFASAQGIIHRDLKPANVMIGRFGEVYVLDWGIAVSLNDDDAGRLPLAKDVVGVAGTPGYMAPEMVADTGEDLCPATDVYLLGAVLHELITKQKRHQGDSLHHVLVSSLRSSAHVYEDYLPSELTTIANRATMADPAARYASAGAFRQAIVDFLEHESSRELSDDAGLRLQTWANLGTEEAEADPLVVQDLFSEARFGFEQAIKAWPDNQEARQGLQRCLERKFEHDLARDDFESASVVLASLAEQRPDLVSRLSDLKSRLQSRRSELKTLRHLQQARDLNVGRRTRAFLMLVSAVAFALVAAGGGWLRDVDGVELYTYFYVTSAAKLVAAGLLFAWAKESLTKTQVNRQLTAVTFLLIVMELAVRPFADMLGHPIEHSLLIDFGVYALVSATLAITVDKRLAWCPAFYIAGVVAASWSMAAIFYLLALAHLASFVFMAAAWRPETLLRSAEERAADRAKTQRAGGGR